MISTLTGLNHVVVSGGSSFFPYVNMSNPSAGMVRYNGNTQNLEAYDGVNWVKINYGNASVDLSEDANAAITWAMNKLSEESEIAQMAEENAAIKVAYDNLKKAAQQLKTTIILSKDQV